MPIGPRQPEGTEPHPEAPQVGNCDPQPTHMGCLRGPAGPPGDPKAASCPSAQRGERGNLAPAGMAQWSPLSPGRPRPQPGLGHKPPRGPLSPASRPLGPRAWEVAPTLRKQHFRRQSSSALRITGRPQPSQAAGICPFPTAPSPDPGPSPGRVRVKREGITAAPPA